MRRIYPYIKQPDDCPRCHSDQLRATVHLVCNHAAAVIAEPAGMWTKVECDCGLVYFVEPPTPEEASAATKH